MKSILSLFLILFPLFAEGSQPVKIVSGVQAATRDAIVKEFSRNEAGFETDPVKSMEANRQTFERLIEEGIACNVAELDTATATVNEIARTALLLYAYSKDTDAASDLLFEAGKKGNAVCANLLL